VINSHKRKSLKKLYLYLKKHQKIEKETAFLKIFDAPYTSKKDALLRNELRLLNKELELFMIKQEWKKNLNINSNENQLSLIKIYLERKEFGLFEQTWRKLYKKAQEQRLYSIKIELINLFFFYKKTAAEFDIGLYYELKELLEEALRCTVAQMQVDYKELELKDAFVQRNLYALTGQKYENKRVTTYYNRENNLGTDIIVEFLDYRIQSYFLSGIEKIDLLQKALQSAKLVEEEYPKYPSLNASAVTIEITIGLEYFLLNEYKKADVCYVRILDKVNVLSVPQRAAMYFNYISNLICLEAYDRAIEWYESSDNVWREAPQVVYRMHYIVCWAYIMQGKYEKPMAMLLEHNIQKRPENDFVYARLLLTILYYSTEQLELAEREAYNLVQNHRYKTPKEETYIEYSKLIYQHIQAIHVLEVDKKNDKLKVVQQNLDTMYHANISSASMMMYRWITTQNERAMLC